MSGTSFKPTSLDIALERDPVAKASDQDIRAAACEAPPQMILSHAPSLESEKATHEGQRLTAAASLAGGMIAAEGRVVTAAEAVEKVRAVLDELDHV